VAADLRFKRYRIFVSSNRKRTLETSE